MNDLESKDIDLSFLGKLKPDHVAIRIADGIIDPMSLKAYEFSMNSIKLGQSDQNKTPYKRIENQVDGFKSRHYENKTPTDEVDGSKKLDEFINNNGFKDSQ